MEVRLSMSGWKVPPDQGRAETAALSVAIVGAVLVIALVGVLAFFLLIYGW